MKLDSLKSGAARNQFNAGGLAECAQLTEEALKDVRTMSYLLYPPLLEELGLKSAVPWYVDGFTKRSRIKTTLEMTPEFGRLPHDLEVALFRVPQESLTNVHRHSGSATAAVRLVGICECSVAVANALAPLKEHADMVSAASNGLGVEKIIGKLLADDLASLTSEVKRHNIFLGRTPDGKDLGFAPYDSRMIVAGPSGGGKSTIVTAMLERLIESQYQVCVLDPEGDYDDCDMCVALGGSDRVPAVSEIMKLLKNGRESISVNLLGVPLTDRPAYFVSLLPRLQELRAQTGRPHWLVVDEVHHLLPAEWDSMSLSVPKDLGNFVLITVHPDRLAPVLRSDVNLVIVIGPDPAQIVREVNPEAGRDLDSLAFAHCTNGAGTAGSESVMIRMFSLFPAPRRLPLIPLRPGR